jgi:ubiquinone/menaquinone biosynthesis C-methylase UbiE
MSKDNYLDGLKANKLQTEAYYKKSFVKTEQQKFLEELLDIEEREFFDVADIACGGGSLSYHLNEKFPKASFTLVDYNDDAIDIARKNNPNNNFKFIIDSIYDLRSLSNESFDLVCCWQTLSWIDDPSSALKQLLRITKPGGKLYLSSLFNKDFDVDIYSKVIDHTRESGKENISFSYNTYSEYTIKKWLEGQARDFKIHAFAPKIDFTYEGRGIGTFTRSIGDQRIQISAGHLLNWAVLEITK